MYLVINVFQVMKSLFLFFLLISPIVVYSQDIKNLDSKYGFNKFKLEGDIVKYKSNLKFVLHDKKTGVDKYFYTKKDISVFGYDNIDEVNLGFYKKRLYFIDVILNPSSDDSVYENIILKLVSLYGNPSISSRKSQFSDLIDYYDLINQWQTPKMTLSVYLYKSISPIHPKKISISLVSEKLGREIDSSGF